MKVTSKFHFEFPIETFGKAECLDKGIQTNAEAN